MVRYSYDFRAEVIAARRESHETTAQVARQYGISPSTLKSWMDTFYAENPQELEADNQALRDERAATGRAGRAEKAVAVAPSVDLRLLKQVFLPATCWVE